jgi:hypothetical protein
MNYKYIILGVIVLILLYILYVNFSTTSTVITKQQSLNLLSTTSIIVSKNPVSVRFSLGMWVYVNTFPTASSKYYIFSSNRISLFFQAPNPLLQMTIAQTNCSTTTTPPDINITTNFPMQSWTNVVIVVDGVYVDMYINGQLMQSVMLPCIQDTSVDVSTIVLGGTSSSVTTFDAYLSKFNRWTYAQGPQEVWNNYISESTKNTFKNFFSNYGVNVGVLKDNIQESTYRIL